MRLFNATRPLGRALLSTRLLTLLLAAVALSPSGPRPACLACLASASPAPAPATASSDVPEVVDQTVSWQRGTGYGWDALVAQGLLNLVKDKQNGRPQGQCTWNKLYVRREWSAFSKAERKEYIRAVLCLQTKPSRLDPVQFPGARNRYDDFVGVHIQQTQSIHFTGNFLTWHRYYVWAYEQTLRNECGYTGYQPYMNWAKYANDPVNTPLFDGSDSSMSGNGVYRQHDPVDLFGLILPAQNGGGCIYNGPFKNWTINLGPGQPTLNYIPPNPRPDGLGYNPRCIIRDLSPYVGQHYLQDSQLVAQIVNYNTITSWQDNLQGNPPVGLGPHGGGHFLTAGDPGGDLFASPGDPYFFLHHGAIDRYFWTWQNQAPSTRTYVVGGTITLQNQPPSRNATLSDLLDLSVIGLAGVLKINNTLSTLGAEGSPFCYIYA